MHENKAICEKCGGHCCKNMPGETIPADFGKTKEEIKKNLTEALRSENWSIDWWEGDIKNGDNIHSYYIRPRVKETEPEHLFDPAWRGECVFLEETGCSLKADERPHGCRILEPKSDGSCISHTTYTNGKEHACHAWYEYNDLIEACANEVRR